MRTRGYLPHLEEENGIYFITFRLAGTIPFRLIRKWELEKKLILEAAAQQRRKLTPFEVRRLNDLQFARIDEYLDRGLGSCWLSSSSVAEMVVNAMKYFDGDRYHLDTWCVMPNHVHSIVEPIGGWKLANVLHSWKSFTSTEANRILNRKGNFGRESIMID